MDLTSKDDKATFVITVPKPGFSGSSRTRLEAAGRLEPVAGHPERYLWTPAIPPMDLTELPRQLRAICGADVDVQPLLRDEKGEPKIPTGQVTVRFKDSPSDSELREFAESLGLAVDRRNAYVPSQVSFRPAKGLCQPVNEVVERIRESDPRVQRVWPETLGTYRRE